MDSIYAKIINIDFLYEQRVHRKPILLHCLSNKVHILKLSLIIPLLLIITVVISLTSVILERVRRHCIRHL